MATHEDVRRICAGLPGAVEGEGRFGFGVETRGKVRGFCWTWMERVEPKRPKIENPGVLAVSTPGLGAKEILTGSAWWVEDDHYRGYPAVLVRLEAVGAEELEDLLVEAWRSKAPKSLIAHVDSGGGRSI